MNVINEATVDLDAIIGCDFLHGTHLTNLIDPPGRSYASRK
jgi:hypothetical protein